MAISEVKKKKKKYLPAEVVSDIFARLPLKTLRSVILVNKFCHKLISVPAFARAHLKHSIQGKASFSGYRFIFGTSWDDSSLEQISFESLLCKSPSVNIVTLHYPKIAQWRTEPWFIGSCDGLLCFKKEGHILLWNPCTGKCNKLPRLHIKNVFFTYGFGYDESTNDYKVVALCFLHDKALSLVNVWSSKRNSWKQIQDFGGHVSCRHMGKLVSGKLHWLTNDEREDIISFDMGSEVFGIVEQPGSDYKDGCGKMTLDVLEGCICLLISYEKRKYVDVWVMKEYGVKESWTKVFNVSCVNILNYLSSCSVLPNGEILFDSYECFAVYDPKADSLRSSGVRRFGRIYGPPVMYVQSLVSPVV